MRVCIHRGSKQIGGYWERDSYNKLKEWLERNSIPKISIHTSGHASPGDLKKIVTAIVNSRPMYTSHSRLDVYHQKECGGG